MSLVRRVQRLAGGVAAAALSLTAAGCTVTASTGRELHVTASAYPYAFVVQRIGGPHVVVSDLVATGVEPHGVALAPKQLADVARADLTVYATGWQPAVQRAVKLARPNHLRLLNVSSVAPMSLTYTFDGVTQPDPHVWLDPERMLAIAKAVEARLTKLDPTHGRIYRRNGEHLEIKLRRLDAQWRHGLANCQRHTFVVAHAAFGYLAQRYHLRQVAITGLDPRVTPPQRRQRRIEALIRRTGLTTVLIGRLTSPNVAQRIADDTGSQVQTLDPIESLTDQTKDQNYLTLMRENLVVLQAADGCS